MSTSIIAQLPDVPRAAEARLPVLPEGVRTDEMPGERPLRFGQARRMVIKIGSAVLRDGPDFDRVTFAALVRDIVGLRRGGVEVVVVCSGAVALGLARLGERNRPQDLARLQATAAIGQGALIRLWNDELGHYGLMAGQVLLTHEDLQGRHRFLNARHTLRALLELGAVPVINENDTIATEEIKLGDNDLLSSVVVGLTEADLLVILSDVDGLYDRDPSEPGARRVTWVPRIDARLLALAGGSRSGLGSGGMQTKIQSIAQINRLGVAGIIARGKTPAVLQRLAAGERLGTWFAAEDTSIGSRKHWIAYAHKSEGRVYVDAGAVRALEQRGGSLLPIGVVRVEGEFGEGALVEVVAPEGRVFARGLVSYDAETIAGALGVRSADAGGLDPSRPVVIHRDDLVLLPLAPV